MDPTVPSLRWSRWKLRALCRRCQRQRRCCPLQVELGLAALWEEAGGKVRVGSLCFVGLAFSSPGQVVPVGRIKVCLGLRGQEALGAFGGQLLWAVGLWVVRGLFSLLSVAGIGGWVQGVRVLRLNVGCSSPAGEGLQVCLLGEELYKIPAETPEAGEGCT